MLDKIKNRREYEQKVIFENSKKVHLDNIKIIKITLLACSIIFIFNIILFNSENMEGSGYNRLRPGYVILIFLICIMFILLCKFKELNSYIFVYSMYIIGLLYCLISSCLLAPDNLGVFILAWIFQVPVLYIDKSWRIESFTIISGILYLVMCSQFKSPLLLQEEIINVESITILALFIGRMTRNAKLENYDTKATLSNYAYNDTLTKLYNRRKLFEDLANSEKLDVVEYVQAIAIIDIDFFKTYNDTYGHRAGDICLTQIGQVFLELSKAYNIDFYRYGGEEFIVCFKSNDEKAIFQICNKIKKSVEELALNHIGNPQGIVTISIGFAMLEDSVERKYERLITLADKALYYVKAHGRNQVEMYK